MSGYSCKEVPKLKGGARLTSSETSLAMLDYLEFNQTSAVLLENIEAMATEEELTQGWAGVLSAGPAELRVQEERLLQFAPGAPANPWGHRDEPLGGALG